MRRARALYLQSQRRNLKHTLAGDTQRLAACGKEANPGCFLQDDIRKDCDGVQKVLAVVENKQRFARGEVGDQERGRPLSGLVSQAQAGNHCLRNQMGIFETGEVDEPNAVVHGPLEIRGGAESEAGLAYAARSHQGEQAGAGECGFDLGQQLAPADKTGRLCRQFARGRWLGDRHKVSLGWGWGTVIEYQVELGPSRRC